MKNATHAPETEAALTAAENTSLSRLVEKTAAQIRTYVADGQLHAPPGYHVENALKAAWLTLRELRTKDGRTALESCRPASIAASLLAMAVQGLDPARQQCWFIVYGDQLVCQRSVWGDQALCQRYVPGCRVAGAAVYEGDEIEYEIVEGQQVVTKHVQRLENVAAGKVAAAYAAVYDGAGRPLSAVVMPIEQIRKSWAMGNGYREGAGVHAKFPAEMAVRTAVRKACKPVLQSHAENVVLEHVRAMEAAEAQAEGAAIALAAGQEAVSLPPAVEPCQEAPF